MKKPKSWLNIAVFGAFILSMTGILLFSQDRDYSENEKRYLARRPEISLSGFLNGTLQKAMEDWAEDQFPLRDGYVGLNAYWTLASGRNAVQDIYYCKDGYLINAPKSQDLSTFQTNLNNFDTFSGQIDIPSELVLVPSTGYLKEELLPKGHLPYPDDDAFQAAKDTLTNVTFYDFREAFELARYTKDTGFPFYLDGESTPICYRTDHHLTAAGNGILYRAYCKAHGLEPVDHAYTPHDGFYGTTWSGSGYWGVKPDRIGTWDGPENVTVTITDSGKEPVVSSSIFFPAHLEEMDKYPVYLDGNHTMVRIDNPNATDDTTLLIVKDSYAHCFTAMLADNYKTIYMIDLRYYRDSVSDFIAEHEIDRLLYFYGVDTLLTDTNSAWLLRTDSGIRN